MESLYFHLDMDAFYASVEQIDNPTYKGKPVIVGGDSSRSVVSACSYEARRYGVHSAMPIFKAKQLCPHGIFCPVNMERYNEISKKIMQQLSNYSPKMIQISIDEAFLNMTGTEKLFGTPLEVAKKIKKEILEQTELKISIGIGSNPYIAKLASDYKKPDGLYLVKKGDEINFIDNYKLENLWGIGKKSNEQLTKKGLFYPKQIREKSINWLELNLGKSVSKFLYKACHGKDPGILSEKIKNHSISNEATLPSDTTNIEVIKSKLLELSHQVMFRMMQKNQLGKTLFVKIKYSDFKSITIQKTLKENLKAGEELFELALDLFNKKWNSREPIRLIGIGISSLSEKNDPPTLFEDTRITAKKSVETAVLKIMNKGGNIKKASLLKNEKITKE